GPGHLQGQAFMRAARIIMVAGTTSIRSFISGNSATALRICLTPMSIISAASPDEFLGVQTVLLCSASPTINKVSYTPTAYDRHIACWVLSELASWRLATL